MHDATGKESGGKPPHSKGIECDDLRVVFNWRGDRYGHTIQRRINNDWIAVLESVEGQSHEDCPPSPPLQTLHVEARENGPVALLVGMAGKVHWSASISAEAFSNGILFDVAARVIKKQQWLGSTYDWCKPLDSFDYTPEKGAVVAGLLRLQVVSAAQSTSVAILFGDEDRWYIHASLPRLSRPHTVRWQYRITPS